MLRLTSFSVCRLWIGVVVTATALAPCLKSAHGQSYGVLSSSRPQCDGCTIQLNSILKIPSSGSRPIGGLPSAIVQTPGGFYLIAESQTPYEIVVYDARGAFRRVVGRQGRGPGEYQRISAIAIGKADSVYVFDSGNGRVTVLSPELVYVRSLTFPGGVYEGVMTAEGFLVANAVSGSPEHIGMPLIAADANGRITAFGSEDAVYRPDLRFVTMRALSKAITSGLWTVPRPRYVLEHWAVNGTRTRALERKVDWFSPYISRPRITAQQPILPWVAAVREDGARRIWTMVAVPVPDWTKRWNEFKLDERKLFSPSQRMQDVIIEVVDVQRNALLASQKFARNLFGFLSDSTLYSYAEDPAGEPSLEIWQFRLNIPQARRK